MKNFLIKAIALFLCSVGFAEPKLVVSFATTHLNGIPEAVSGVVVSPSGEERQTAPMGPFEQSNIIFDTPEVGTYNAYFIVFNLGSFHLCHIAGGIVVNMTNRLETPIEISPQKSRIQTFPFGRQIDIGSISRPICTFQITEADISGEE